MHFYVLTNIKVTIAHLEKMDNLKSLHTVKYI